LTEEYFSAKMKASKKGAIMALLKFSKRRRRKKNVRNVSRIADWFRRSGVCVFKEALGIA
jgi:hypothetical protein